MTSWKDWNHFLRPNLWPVILAAFFLGTLATKSFIFSEAIGIGVVITIILCSASITVNHYFDRHEDKKSDQLYRFPVASGQIPEAAAARFSISLLLVAALLTIGFLNAIAQLIVLFGIFWIFTYSARPFQTKKRTWLALPWNAAGYGALPFLLGFYILNGALNLNVLLLAVVPSIITVIGHLLLGVRDIETDMKNKIRTTVTVLGKEKVIQVTTALLGITGLIILYLMVVQFLNLLALVSIAAGLYIGYEHKRMKTQSDVLARTRILQLAYTIGGVVFVLSVL